MYKALYLLAEFCISLVLHSTYLHFYSRFLERGPLLQGKRYWIALFLISFVGNINAYIFSGEIRLAVNVLFWLLLLCLFKGKLQNKALIFMVLYILQFAMQMFVIFILISLKVETSASVIYSPSYIMSDLLLVSLLLITERAVCALFAKQLTSLSRRVALVCLPLLLLYFLVILGLSFALPLFLHSVVNDNKVLHFFATDFSRVLYAVLILLAMPLVVFVTRTLQKHEKTLAESKLDNIRMEYALSDAKQRSRSDELMADVRRELRQALDAGLDESESTSRLKKIHERLQRLKSPDPESCGNLLVDCVLKNKLQAIRQSGIAAQWTTLPLPPVLSIPDPQLCALLGNAMDNAAEAAKDCENAHVTVNSTADESGALHILIRNSCADPEKSVSTAEQRSRKRRNAMGVGLQSMRNILHENGGEMSLSPLPEQSEVELKLYLPMKERS